MEESELRCNELDSRVDSDTSTSTESLECFCSEPFLTGSSDDFYRKQVEKYAALNVKLQQVLEILNSEIQTVSIREECLLKPEIAPLKSPHSSFIQRRRHNCH